MQSKPPPTIETSAELEPTPGRRTATLTESDHGKVRLAPRAPATLLRLVGRAEPTFILSESKPVFTIGSGACDLVIARTLSKKVSAFHATFTRTHDAVRVDDQDSKNGSFADAGEARLRTFYARPGRRFWLADVGLMTLDTYLAVLRPRLAWHLGLDRHDAIDEAIEVIASGRPLALVGPRGNDSAMLAEAIHEASAQRQGACLANDGAALPSLETVVGATVVLDLERVAKVSAPYCARLFDESAALRPIFLAESVSRVKSRLDTYRDALKVIPLPPLARRREDVLTLIAMDWIDRRARHCVDELGPGRHGLTKHRWPGDLVELRQASERLLAYVETGRSVRRTAIALGITRQSLHSSFKRIGYVPGDADS